MATTKLPVLEFVLKNYKNFNARVTRDALLAYWRHVEGGGKMFWAVAGAMSSAQLGITLAPAIRAGLIHGLSVTGANLEESLFRLVAHDSYKDFPEYRYFTKDDDTRILEERMRRVTDTSIPEDEAFRAVEKFIVPMWLDATKTGKRRFWHEYFYELIQTIPRKLHEGERRRVLAARRGEGEPADRRPRPRGLDLRQHLRVPREGRASAAPRIVKSGIEYMAELYDQYKELSKGEGRRLLPDRRRHRRRLPDLRRPVDQVRPAGAGEALGLLLPDLRLDDVLRLLLGRDAEREDHLGQAHARHADVRRSSPTPRSSRRSCSARSSSARRTRRRPTR